MSLNTFTLLEHSESGYLSAVLKDIDSNEKINKKKYFKTFQEALDYCSQLAPDSEYGIILGRGFGDLKDFETFKENGK